MAGTADASGTGGMETRWFLQPEKRFYRVFIDFGADDAELAGDVGAAVSYVGLARNIVEVDPVAVFAGNDALGAEDHAEVAAVGLFEGSLVIVVMMLMVMLVIIVFMLMIMVVAAAGAVRAMVVMVVMFMFFCFEECSGHVVCGERVLDRFSDLCAGEFLPRGGDDLGVVVDLADQLNRGVELALGDVAGTGQDDGAGILDLVLVELLEVLQVDLALAGVDDGNCAADLGALDLLDSSHYVRELADTGWLDEDTVRRELVDDFLQRGAEVADEGAADAAGVHLRHLDAGLLHKAAVNADLAEFVLNEHQLLSVVTIGNEFLDESCFPGA